MIRREKRVVGGKPEPVRGTRHIYARYEGPVLVVKLDRSLAVFTSLVCEGVDCGCGREVVVRGEDCTGRLWSVEGSPGKDGVFV